MPLPRPMMIQAQTSLMLRAEKANKKPARDERRDERPGGDHQLAHLRRGSQMLLVDVVREEAGGLIDPGAEARHRRRDERHDHQAAQPGRDRVEQHGRHDPLGIDRAQFADELQPRRPVVAEDLLELRDQVRAAAISGACAISAVIVAQSPSG